jgi:hypothetical protein
MKNYQINILLIWQDHQHKIKFEKNLIDYHNQEIILPVIFGKEIKLEPFSTNVKD